MQQHTVDVAVIGAGSSGLVAWRSARTAGASAMIIDPGPLGTTCARVGCMPSKLLIAAAEAAHHAREGHVFGVHAQPQIDGPAVMARVQRERDRFVGFVLQSIEKARKHDSFLEGRARFIDANTLRVEGANGQAMAEVRAKAFVVAVGSEPVTPPPFRGLGDRLLSNESIFELPDLPRSVLVLGAGVIGLELGQALRRLGVEITIVTIDDAFGPLRDRFCREAARRALGEELDIFLSYRLEHLERRDDTVHIRFTDSSGKAHQRVVERVLVAAGRRPRLNDLGLEQAGIQLDRGRVSNWNPTTMQIGESHVFLAGDATEYRPVLHEASDEGHIAGKNAATFPEVLAGPRRTPLTIVFTDPQLAVVGAPYTDMSCDQHRAGEIDYGDQGRARVMHQNRGLVRIYGEVGSETLLGAEMVGPSVEHTAHLLAWAIQQRLTVSRVLEMPFYHPVVEEGIRTALRHLQTELRTARPLGAECTEFGPGT